MFKSILSILLLGLLLVSSASAQKNEEAKKLFNEGNAMLKSGDFNGAISKYNGAIALEKHQFYYYQRGLAQKKAGKNNDAAASFEEAVKIDPKFAEAYHALGGVYFTKGDYQKAINCYTSALKENPKLGPSKKGLAAAQTAQALEVLKKGDVPLSIQLSKKAIENDPGFGKAYIALAQAYNKGGQYKDAVDAATNAVKKGAAPNGAAYFELGVAYRNLGNNAEAKKAFENARKDPTYASSADYELKKLK